MIDMHSHILPNIDDGSKSIEETKELIEEAKNAGFEAIVSTSHYIEGYYEVENEKRQEYIDELKDNIKIYIGNEVYLSENIIKLLKEQKIATINNTKYILFETPLNAKPMMLDEIIYEMLQNKLVPILAHPERYSYIKQNPNMVKQLVQKGVLMQANYASIIGNYGRKSQIVVKKLLENNLIHFLGSDVHKTKTIYPKIPEILTKLNKLIGKEKVEELVNINPKLVLKNEKIEVEVPEKDINFNLKEKIMMSI